MSYKIKDQRSRTLSTCTYFIKNYGDWTIENKVLDIWQILDILSLRCEILLMSAENGVRDYNKNL